MNEQEMKEQVGASDAKHKEEPRPKKPYKTPTLEKLGSPEELTEGIQFLLVPENHGISQ